MRGKNDGRRLSFQKNSRNSPTRCAVVTVGEVGVAGAVGHGASRARGRGAGLLGTVAAWGTHRS